jgi:hypothetical protein
VEKAILNLKEEVRRVKDEEAERLKKEYRLNKYEERFKVSMEKMMKAMFGDKDKMKYLNSKNH